MLTAIDGTHRGRLVKDSKTGKPKMNCRNWECGVVISVSRDTPPGDAKTSTGFTATGSPGTDANDLTSVFGTMIPVPMQVPGRLYEPDEEPWFFAGGR